MNDRRIDPLKHYEKAKSPETGFFFWKQESFYNLVYALGLAKNH
jgi:hypothetical protein